jgi:hypothetical protein
MIIYDHSIQRTDKVSIKQSMASKINYLGQHCYYAFAYCSLISIIFVASSCNNLACRRILNIYKKINNKCHAIKGNLITNYKINRLI